MMVSSVMPMPFSVFISSKDIMDDERTTVENTLRGLDMVPMRVETTTWIATTINDEYLQQIRKCQIVILLVDLDSEDIEHADEYYRFVRQEIELAFEEGKTVLAFFKQAHDSVTIDRFISEIQYKVFHRRFRNCSELSEFVSKSVMNELFRKYTHAPSLIESRREIYEYSARLTTQCQYRLYISQSSPTLLMGPRIGQKHENDFYEALRSILSRTQTGTMPIEIVVLFRRHTLEREVKEKSRDYDYQSFHNNCSSLRSLLNDRLFIIDSSDDVVPFMVSDHSYIIGHIVEKSDLPPKGIPLVKLELPVF